MHIAFGDAAVHLDVDLLARLQNIRTEAAYLIERLGDEKFSAVPRDDAHQKHLIEKRKIGFDDLDGSGRVDDESAAHPFGADHVQRVLDVLLADAVASFVMHGHRICPRARKVFDLRLRMLDHQMHVERQFGALADLFDHLRTERDRVDEAPVHDVAVNEVGTAVFQQSSLLI